MGSALFFGAGILGIEVVVLLALFFADASPHGKYARAVKRLLVFIVACLIVSTLLNMFGLWFALCIPVGFGLTLVALSIRK